MISELNQHQGRWLMLAIGLALVLSVFLNVGLHPLSMEEPRRALIALEMRFNDNPWVPTQYGEPYYRKPPFYNWVILLGYNLFGSYSEFATRFLSIVSYLLTGFICFWLGRKYVSTTVGFFSALLFLTANDLLFYFTLVAGEIDLFYSLVTYLTFLCIFHFGERQRYYLMFAIVYGLGAVGTLTKGLPTPVFLAVSLLVYFGSRRSLRQLISLPHAAGVGLYLTLVGGYLWIYSRHES